MDLSKGMPNRIQLIHNKKNWTQFLDFENTAFRSRTRHQTGHLQNTCHDAKKDSRRKKKSRKEPKGWQFPPNESDEEEDYEKAPIPTQNTQGKEGTKEAMQEQSDLQVTTELEGYLKQWILAESNVIIHLKILIQTRKLQE